MAPALSALREVHHIMTTDFPNLDVPWLHGYIQNGSAAELAVHLPGRYRFDRSTHRLDYTRTGSTERDMMEADAAAHRQYGRLVEPQMAHFARLMEAVAPSLRRFHNAVKAVHDYIAKERRHAKTMTAMAVMFYVVTAVILGWLLYSNLERKREWHPRVQIIGRQLLILLAINALVWTWVRLMSSHVAQLEKLDTSFYDKYDHNLARNVFVLYTQAYARGEHRAFSRSYSVQRYREQENDEELAELCEEGGASLEDEISKRECIIDGCEGSAKDVDLEEMLGNHMRRTWDTRGDLKGCGKAMVALLHFLAEVHRGTVFDEQDRAGMWRRIRKGVMRLRRLVYRRLDVRQADAEEERTTLGIVRDEVLPLLQLDIMESRELVPDEQARAKADLSVTLKTECWRLCADDPACAWASFDPVHGCVRAVGAGCAEEDKAKLRGCLDQRRTPLQYVDEREASAETETWTTLVKRRNPGDALATSSPSSSLAASSASRGGGGGEGGDGGGEMGASSAGRGLATARAEESTVPATYVCGVGVNETVLGTLTPTPRPQDAEDRAAFDEEKRDHPYAACSERPEGCHVVEVRGRGLPAPRRQVQLWKMVDSDAPEREPYREVFARPRGGDGATAFCLRASPRALYDANVEKNAFVTMSAYQPVLVERIVKAIKHHRVRIMLPEHAQYLHHELEAFYGAALYRSQLRARVEEVLFKAHGAIQALWKEVGDTARYITQTRFDEKVGGMNQTRVRRLFEDVGRLARLTQNHLNNFPEFASGDGGNGYAGGLRGEIVRGLMTDGISALLLGTILVLVDRVYHLSRLSSDGGYKGRLSFGSAIFNVGTLLATIFVFAVTLMVSSLLRATARDRFNRSVAEENGRRLVFGARRATGRLAQLLEHLLGATVGENERNAESVRRNLALTYSAVGWTQGLRELEPKEEGGPPKDLTQVAPPDTRSLYRAIRDVIERFDSCNNLDGNGDVVPFPTYELVMYVLIALVVVAVLFATYGQLKPMQRINNIQRLNEIREDLQDGIPPSSQFATILSCSRPSDETSTYITLVVMAVLMLGTIMLSVFMMRSSRSYEMGLYASALHSKGKCTV